MNDVYRDFGMPPVERLARAIAKKRGYGSDDLVPETGYSNARAVPAWWKFQDAALDYLAMREAESDQHSDDNKVE